jgi:hypothetical protein
LFERKIQRELKKVLIGRFLEIAGTDFSELTVDT